MEQCGSLILDLRVLNFSGFDPINWNFLSVLLGGRNVMTSIRHCGKLGTSGPRCVSVSIPSGGFLVLDVFIVCNTQIASIAACVKVND